MDHENGWSFCRVIRQNIVEPIHKKDGESEKISIDPCRFHGDFVFSMDTACKKDPLRDLFVRMAYLK